MNKNLLILGADTYGIVVKEVAEEMGCFEKIAFLDDTCGTAGSNCKVEIVGKLSDYEKFSTEYSYAIPTMDNPELRLQLLENLEAASYTIPILVSDRAYVSPSAQVEKGVVVEPLAAIHANSVVGGASFISIGAVIDHNAFVAPACHIGCNAVIMSHAWVKAGTKVKPCETVSSFDAENIREKSVSTHIPTYSKDDEWVKRYIEQNGHEPSFFD